MLFMFKLVSSCDNGISFYMGHDFHRQDNAQQARIKTELKRQGMDCEK